MLQAFVKKGKVITADIPAPVVSEGSVLIKVFYSCISAGTEISTVEDSKISLIRKVIEKPERIIEAIKIKDKLHSMGICVWLMITCSRTLNDDGTVNELTDKVFTMLKKYN